MKIGIKSSSRAYKVAVRVVEPAGDDYRPELLDSAESLMSEAEFLDEVLGRGDGDPDMHGYPSHMEADCE